MARDPDGPSTVSVAPSLPDGLDDRARAEILDAHAVMRRLVSMIPKDFAYGDEMAAGFRPRQSDGES